MAYREDFGSSRYPPARDPRYDYPPPPPVRELRRPITPPRESYREYREYPAGPPPARSTRDYDRDYRMRGPPNRYDSHPSSYFPPESDGPPGYPPRSYGPPAAAPREVYDRYERRPPPSSDRYGPPYPSPSNIRPRTPPRPSHPTRYFIYINSLEQTDTRHIVIIRLLLNTADGLTHRRRRRHVMPVVSIRRASEALISRRIGTG